MKVIKLLKSFCFQLVWKLSPLLSAVWQSESVPGWFSVLNLLIRIIWFRAVFFLAMLMWLPRLWAHTSSNLKDCLYAECHAGSSSPRPLHLACSRTPSIFTFVQSNDFASFLTLYLKPHRQSIRKSYWLSPQNTSRKWCCNRTHYCFTSQKTPIISHEPGCFRITY